MSSHRTGSRARHRRALVLTSAVATLLSAAAGAQTPPPAAAAPAAPAAAPAATTSNLNINPKRLTFDRLGRSATVFVFNQGSAATTFDVELVDRVMLPDGQIAAAADADTRAELKPLVARLKSARPMVLATPRRVSLAANSGQTIRVRAGSAEEVAPGEYRTHLTVTALPAADAGLTAETAAAPREGQLSFRVNTVVGLSIPVIVRVGPVDVRAAIENARIARATPPGAGADAAKIAILSFDLVRLGVNSLFGSLEVRGAKERGDREPLGAVRGIGVYPEIERRAVTVALRRIPAPGEQIEISFQDDDLTPGKQLARATLTAP